MDNINADLMKMQEENAELRARLDSDQSGGESKVNALAIIVFIFCGFTIGAIIAITIFMPDTQAQALNITIIGFMTPTILSLMGYAIQQNHKQMNSRLNQLVAETGKARFAEGKMAEKNEQAAIAVNKVVSNDVYTGQP